MSIERRRFNMSEPPQKPANFYLIIFFLGFVFILALIGYAVIAIIDLPSATNLHDVFWGLGICIVFFVVLDLCVLYYYLSYVTYYSSTLEIDADGIRRIKNGIVQEQYEWSETAVFYINARHTPATSDWILVTKDILKNPSRKMFRMRGLWALKHTKNLLLQISYTPEKEAILEQYLTKRLL